MAEIIMYADDTVLLINNPDPVVAIHEMQEVLDYTSRWCSKNKLTVNAKKTKQMLVLRYRSRRND